MAWHMHTPPLPSIFSLPWALPSGYSWRQLQQCHVYIDNMQYGTNTVHVLMLHIFNIYCSMCGQNQCIKWQVWEIRGIGQGPGYYFPIVLVVSVNIIHSHAYLPSYVRYLSLAKSSCCDNSGLHGPNRPPIETNPITIITNIYAEIDSE